jgi:protein tyrosine/serine phosphatase
MRISSIHIFILSTETISVLGFSLSSLSCRDNLFWWSSQKRPLTKTRQETTTKRFAIPKDINLDEVKDIEITPEEKDFLMKTRLLCSERNIGFDCIKNARDLSSPPGSPIKPNRLYRTGRLSEASEKDIDFLLSQKQIKTIIDLRSPTELKEDEGLLRFDIFGDFTNLVWLERGRKRDGCVIEIEPGKSPIIKRRRFLSRGSTFLSDYDDDDDDNDGDVIEEDDCDICGDGSVPASSVGSRPRSRRERYFVSLMNEFKYVRGTLSKVRKRDLARTVLKSPGALLSRRVRDSVKGPFLNKINDGGLPMLNELLLRFGAPGIQYVLELCADRSRHPVIFHCTAGKDRTGMITAIILSLLGVPDEEIIQDYSLSANVYAEMNDHKAMVGALSQRNLDPKTFLGAPPQVMKDTLDAIREDYGSVQGYLTWIGFGPEKQAKLKKALTDE